MTSSQYLRKVQNLPLTKRKIIFWLIIIIFGLSICFLYVINIRNRIKNFPLDNSLKELSFPDLKKGLGEMPRFETKEEIEELKNDIKKAEEMLKENSD